MKLHANAALSLKKRRLLVHRVVEEGWSLTRRPRPPKSASRQLESGSAAIAPRARPACSTAPRRPHVHNRTPEDRIEVIRALRRLRMTGAEIAEVLEMAETTVSGILTRFGLGKLGRLGLEPAQRYERTRPGELSTSTSRSSGGSRAARASAHGRPRYNPTRDDRWRPAQAGRLGVRPRLRRRRHPLCLRRGARRREGDDRGRLLAPGAFGSSPPRRQGRGGDHRQRLGLRSAIHAIACRALGLKHLRTRPYRPANQRQGRALHPHDARRLGLRGDLPQLSRAHRCPRGLALALQLPPTTRRPRPKATGSSARRAEQRARVLHTSSSLARQWRARSRLRSRNTVSRPLPTVDPVA